MVLGILIVLAFAAAFAASFFIMHVSLRHPTPAPTDRSSFSFHYLCLGASALTIFPVRAVLLRQADYGDRGAYLILMLLGVVIVPNLLAFIASMGWRSLSNRLVNVIGLSAIAYLLLQWAIIEWVPQVVR